MKLNKLSKKILAMLFVISLSAAGLPSTSQAEGTKVDVLKINETFQTQAGWDFPVTPDYGSIDWSAGPQGGKADPSAKVTIGTTKETRAQLSSWTRDASCAYLVLSFQIFPVEMSEITALYWGTNSSISISGGMDNNANGGNAKALASALVQNRWNTVTTVYNLTADSGSYYASTYVNGAKIVDNLATAAVENKRIQLHFYGNTAKSEFYLDNIYVYQTPEAPQESALAMPALVPGDGYALNGSSVSLLPGSVTPADLKTEPGCAVRVYSDDTFTQLLDEDAFIDSGAQVVIERTDGAINYYTAEAAHEKEVLKINAASQTDSRWFSDCSFEWDVENAAGKSGTSANVAFGTENSVTGTFASETAQIDSNYISMSFEILPSAEAAIENIGWNISGNVLSDSDAVKTALVNDRWNTVTTLCNLEDLTAATYVNGVQVTTCDIVWSGDDIALYISGASGAQIGMDNIYIYQIDVCPSVSRPEIFAAEKYSLAGDTLRFKEGDTVYVSELQYTDGASLQVYEDESFTHLLTNNDRILNNAIAVVEKAGIYRYYSVVGILAHKIHINASANGAVIADKAEAFEGDTVTLTILPDEEFELQSLTVNEGEVAVTEDYTFTMPAADVEIHAVFVPMHVYKIKTSVTGNGTVTVPEGSSAGKTIRIQIQPATGYTLIDLKINDGAIQVTEDYTFQMPESNVTVTAVFEANLVDNTQPVIGKDTLLYDFENGLDGFTVYPSSNIITHENGNLLLHASVSAADNQLSKTFDQPIDGSKYYGIKIRMKLENVTDSAGYLSPTLCVYYEAEGLPMAETRKREVTLEAVKGDDGLYDSDYITYFIDASLIASWSTAHIQTVRFDVLKNGGGTAYIDYIQFIANPAVEAVRYNGIADAPAVMAGAESLEFYLSTPIEGGSVTPDCITIYNEKGGQMKLSSVAYDSAHNAISVIPCENIKSETEYIFIISGIRVNASSADTKYMEGGFRTGKRPINVSNITKDGSVYKITVDNSEPEPAQLIFVATVWKGNIFERYTASSVDVDAQTTTEHTMDVGEIVPGQKIEIYAYSYQDGQPELITNDIFVFNN